MTLEGLGTPEKLHPVQKAFIEEQAVQCGYCINGMIMEAAAFLAMNRTPSEADIKKALANNLCRCGTHARIVRAVMRASEAISGREAMNTDLLASRRDVLKGGALIVSFSWLGLPCEALAQNAPASGKPLALNAVDTLPRHRCKGHGHCLLRQGRSRHRRCKQP